MEKQTHFEDILVQIANSFALFLFCNAYTYVYSS